MTSIIIIIIIFLTVYDDVIMTKSSWQFIDEQIEQQQVIANLQTRSTDLGCHSTYRLLSPASTNHHAVHWPVTVYTWEVHEPTRPSVFDHDFQLEAVYH